ncbi:MAG TPA: hypothetical protein P5072_06285, partial [Parvularculaceae bacterium]|nr:hypothetical protein [Parvularculaceae bacterium]
LSLLLFAKNGALSFQAIASSAVLLACGLIWEVVGILRLRPRPIVTLDAEGISGVSIAPKVNHLPWSRLKSFEIDGGAVVLDFEPADLLSDKPADRISKARVSLRGVSPEEVAAAIEKFWKGEESERRMSAQVALHSRSERFIFDDNVHSPDKLASMRTLVTLGVGGLFALVLGVAELLMADRSALTILSSLPGAFVTGCLLAWSLLGFSNLWPRPIVTIGADGIEGVAIPPNSNSLPWSRMRGFEVESSSIVLEFEPVDLRSEKPADRISKTRLSMQRIKPEEIAVAIEKFWTSPQRG